MSVYRTPSEEQVKAALRRITTPQLRRAFFEGLKNPHWVAPLAREGSFTNPPEPELTEDGLIRDIYWPEIGYLVRVATEVPGEVIDVLLRLSESNNAWVKRGTFEIGAVVPPEHAARLQPLIKAWLPSGLGWRTDPRDLVSYAINLLGGGKPKAGRWFANLLFRPSVAENDSLTRTQLEDYWYDEELPRLVPALGPDGLQVTLPWLVAHERQAGRFTDDSDITFYARDSIRHREDSHHGVEQALIDAVRDLAVRAMVADARRALSLLVGSRMLVARKIAMFALAEALLEVDEYPARARLAELAHELLFDEASADDSCRIDFAELARAVARATGESLAPLTDFIGLGPRVDRDRLREWLSRNEDDDSALDEAVSNYIRRWKHRWLSALGLEPLPQTLRDDLADLDRRFGVIDNPRTPRPLITSWMGPTSPLSQADMATMGPTELLAHLESWRVDGRGWGPEPSHEGQARQLTELLTTSPAALGDAADIVDRLRPTYVRAALGGWEAALKAGSGLNWNQVLRVVGDVLSHSDTSNFDPEGSDFDDDQDMRPSKRAAVGLLEEAVKKKHAPAVPPEVVERFADLLINMAADERAWEEYADRAAAEGMDPLTTSLNWQWPVRLRGLTHLMSWGYDTTWYEAARLAVEGELERDDPHGASRAVIGEALDRLVDAVPEWTLAHSPHLFGGVEGLSVQQQIALTTATAVYRYHHKLFDLLAPAMVAAFNSGEEVVAGWDHAHSGPTQRLGEWAIESVIRGDSTTEDAVPKAFFKTQPPAVRGEALGHIGWNFMHAAAVDDPIRDRLAALWDERVAYVRSNPGSEAELKGFFWFVRSRKFSADWWLPRLHEALELYPALGAERYMIGKEVATAADVDPRCAFEVLKQLLGGRSESALASFDLTRNAVPMVLGRAIASGDSELRDEAVSYMNNLGELGHLTLEAEVNRVLDGSVNQLDVED